MSNTTNDQDTVYENWKIRFPLCFEHTGDCMDFGIQHHKGWNALLERLLTKIEAHLAEKYAMGFRDPERTFTIDQIKEKYGSLRFYVSDADDQIFQWVNEAERESNKTCEICGEPGFLHCRVGGYWVYTRCSNCADPAVMQPTK